MSLLISRTVHALDFKMLSGNEFERLVFATLLRTRYWRSLNWFGQSGGDDGRDIIGSWDDELGQERKFVVACANWQDFTAAKGKSDIIKFTGPGAAVPDALLVVAGSAVSAATKSNIQAFGVARGIGRVEVWSGQDFEEHSRFHAPSVLQRFFNGEVFPDDERELGEFVLKLSDENEAAGAQALAGVFNRSAFTTPIRQESSIPNFRQAISDTISAINTGIWRTSEGTQITRVPHGQSFSNPDVGRLLRSCSAKLNELRIIFDEGIRNRDIRLCGCTEPDCPIFTVTDSRERALTAARADVLRLASEAFALMGVNLGLLMSNG